MVSFDLLGELGVVYSLKGSSQSNLFFVDKGAMVEQRLW
jgi:hypothetical protein